MCQWIKKYHELHDSGAEYDPVARRNGQDLHYILGSTKVALMPKAGTKPAVNNGNPRPPTATTQPRAKPVAASTNKFGGGGGASSA
jgi:hypothetical protein